MNGDRRQLILMRHAKSSWKSAAEADFDRPLNGRGKQDAKKMGRWLLNQDIFPEVIACSPARRAAETAVRISTKINFDANNIRWDDRIYEAGIGDLLSVLASCPKTTNTILLIGHNPGLEQLTSYLCASSLPSPTDGKLVPTATAVRLEIANDWSELSDGDANIISIVRPKEIQ